MNKLTHEQERQLNQWLLDEAPSGTLSLTAVKGYLFAVIASPDEIEVTQWLGNIFEQQTDQLPDEITLIIATLYNQISDQMFDSVMTLPTIVEYSEMVEANFLSGHPLHEWCLGFACGMGFYSDKLLDAPQASEELIESFSLALMAFTFFADRENAQQVVLSQENNNINNFAPMMYQMIQDFVGDYAELIEHLALSTGLYDDDDDDDDNWLE
ncbi:MAG: UPF0149 family protein [Gammaproteobacteria bacterium]|nr:UPF0149 family protein [Gammaproteobacteria bacterium]